MADQALKNLFGKELLKRMAAAVGKAFPTFDQKKFLALNKELEGLEMKARVRLLRDELHAQLPSEYPKALKIILQAAHDESLQGFDIWVFTEFVQTYGLDDLKISLDALKALTCLFTSEFAVRPFLKTHQTETLKYLEQCAKDKNPHIRRWASEGTRPRLPWGERLHDFIKDPSLTLPILELLKFDAELYVRKSISNHLNDIAKDHPDLVIKLLSNWKKTAGDQHAKKVEWIIHRSLRTLIKAGHPEALKLIGVSTKAKLELSKFKLHRKEISLGERLDFECKIISKSTSSQKLVIDYVIHFVKANKKTSGKVFKLKTVTLGAKEELTISKSHHLKKVTTRDYYSGLHYLEIQVNGQILKRTSWTLEI